MVVALQSGGVNIPVESALDHVYGYAVALDMTRRDLQGEAKELRRPWEIGKAFERSAPAARWCRRPKSGIPPAGLVQLKVNGAVRQTGDLDQMIWKVPEMISYLSDYYRAGGRRRDHVGHAFGGWSGSQRRCDGGRDRGGRVIECQGDLTNLFCNTRFAKLLRSGDAASGP